MKVELAKAIFYGKERGFAEKLSVDLDVAMID